MRVCPNCGHRGEEARCPADGFPLVSSRWAEAEAEDGDLLGKVVDGRYQVEALIGKGGMGRVYRARHVMMDRVVALKVLRQDTGPQNLAAVKRFLVEAQACARLRHPHSIQIYDFGATDDGLMYMAMEHLVGEPLDQYLKRYGKVPPARAVSIARQICQALDEAHTKGLVHRDLKPSNVFLCDLPENSEFVKVLDFGIVKLVEEASHQEAGLTETGMVIGSPEYMSPEQIKGVPLDGRSDLYSVGALLYELLTGAKAFRGGSYHETILQHLSAKAPLLPDEIDGEPVPYELGVLIGELLDKEPRNRPARASHVDKALGRIEQLCADEPTRVLHVMPRSFDQDETIIAPTPAALRSTPGTGRGYTPMGTARMPSPVKPAVEDEAPARPSRMPWVVGAAVAFALVAVSAWFFLRPPSPSPSEATVATLPSPAPTQELPASPAPAPPVGPAVAGAAAPGPAVPSRRDFDPQASARHHQEPETHRVVVIEVAPPSARLAVDGRALAKNARDIVLVGNQERTLEASLDGYVTRAQRIDAQAADVVRIALERRPAPPKVDAASAKAPKKVVEPKKVATPKKKDPPKDSGPIVHDPNLFLED
jgi:serine/threonine-protein kinase